MKAFDRLGLLLMVFTFIGIASFNVYADNHERFTLRFEVTNNETGQPLDDAKIVINGSGSVLEIVEPPIVSIIDMCRTGNLPITCRTGGVDATEPGIIEIVVGPGTYNIDVGHEVFKSLSGSISFPRPDGSTIVNVTAPLDPDPNLRKRSLFVNILGRTNDENGNESVEPIDGAQFHVFDSSDGNFLGGGMVQLLIDEDGETEWSSSELIIGEEVIIKAFADGFISKEIRLTIGTDGNQGRGFVSESDTVEFILEQATNEVRQLIVEVFDADTNEPISGASVNLQEIGGASVANGRTSSDGRTDPMAISGNIDPSFGLRVEVSQLGYESALSDVPPSLLQPAEDPNVYTVFLSKKEVAGQCGSGKVCVFLVTNVDQLDYGDDASMENGKRCHYQGGGNCGTEGGDTPIEFIVYMGPFDSKYEANKFYCDDQLEPEKGVRLTQMRIIKFGTDGDWHGVNNVGLRCPAVKPDPPSDPDPQPQPPPVANQGDDYIELNGRRIELNKELKFSLTRGEIQQMVLQCNARGAFGLMSMGNDDESAKESILTAGALLVKTQDLTLLRDFCNKLAQSTSSGGSQSNSLLSGDIPLIPMQSIPGIEFEVELEEGALVTSVFNNNVNVGINTPSTSVQISGKKEVGVAYDPNTNTSTVSAYDGSVIVNPSNSSLPSFSLSEGDQVDVTQNDVGSIQPIESPSLGNLPQITGVGIPSELRLGVPTEWPLSFADGNANINYIRFEQWANGQWMLAGEGDPNVFGMDRGSLSITTECKIAQTVRARVTIGDTDGNIDVQEYTYECVGTSAAPAPDPSPGGSSVLTALDTNRNGFLDDAEIRKAFQYWIMGETIPGTDQTIDDETMRRLVQVWILGMPVGEPASASPATLAHPMKVQSLSFSSSSAMHRTLTVSGQNIESVEFQLYDLNGQLQIQTQSKGSQLQFLLFNKSGQPLANGVYLYVVRTKGHAGEKWQSEVRKFVMLN